MPLDDANRSPDTQVDATTDLLIRARSLIARGWCRRTEARNLIGWPVPPTSKSAVSWCMSGALYAAAQLGNHAAYGFAYRRLTGVIPDNLVAEFNDRQQMVEPILAVFDSAIAIGGQL